MSDTGLRQLQLSLVALLLLAACSAGRDKSELLVTLIADGTERSILLQEAVTVQGLLRDNGIEPGPLDRVEPALDTLLQDAMRVTLVRVIEREECVRQEIPFRTLGDPETAGNTGLAQRVQSGVPGEEERCFRVRLEDGVQRDAIETSRVIIREPVAEVWQRLPSGETEAPEFPGTLVWLADGNAWMARRDSRRPGQLTGNGRLDGEVLALSSDGDSLLYTLRAGDRRGERRNQLWLIANVARAGQATRLQPEEVLAAAWLPGSSSEFAFVSSGAEDRISLIRVDPASGETLDYRELQVTTGADGGTRIAWSHDGNLLAWTQAGSAGIINVTDGTVTALAGKTDASMNAAGCINPSLSWSPDARYVLARLPGVAGLSDLVAMEVTGAYTLTLFADAGPCSRAAYSPQQSAGYLAFLQARYSDRPQSRAGHDLMIADRDGSNLRRLFPPAGQPGLAAQEITWSPDGQQLALVHEEQLLLLDVTDGGAQRFPFPGKVTSVVWSS